jgi:hypothetical protein
LLALLYGAVTAEATVRARGGPLSSPALALRARMAAFARRIMWKISKSKSGGVPRTRGL